mmetsp:Transcript_42565/g.62330  ORF Transcript_42565/g.62330 Transcript_42565/m.62330 type:complete len:135 (-) Transcript_42565:323-727(-)
MIFQKNKISYVNIAAVLHHLTFFFKISNAFQHVICFRNNHKKCLSPILHAFLLHALKTLPVPSLYNLALFLLLRVLKITLVTKFHEVATLVYLALETTNQRLNPVKKCNYYKSIGLNSLRIYTSSYQQSSKRGT